MQVDFLRKELKTETTAPPLRVLIRAIEFCAAEMQVNAHYFRILSAMLTS